MDLRRGKRNALVIEVRQLEKQIERNEATISRLRHDTASAFTSEQTATLKARGEEFQVRLDELNEKLVHLDNGDLDDEIRESIKQQTKLFREKRDVKLQTEREKNDEDDEKKKCEDRRFKAERNAEKEYKYLMRSSYKYMMKVDVPDYIQSKLNALPNNNGYMHRGVLFLGMKPRTKGPFKIFELKKGGITRIEESTATEVRIFEQKGKEQPVLIETKPRRQIQGIRIDRAPEKVVVQSAPKMEDFPALS